jgi:hypothetical protein
MHATIFLNADEKPRAQVLNSRDGLFISFAVDGATFYVPGDNAKAVENARAWAAQLLNAAEQIVETLAHTEPAQQGQEA